MTPLFAEPTEDLGGSVFISNVNELANAAGAGELDGQVTVVWAAPEDVFAKDLFTVTFKVHGDNPYIEEIMTPVSVHVSDLNTPA